MQRINLSNRKSSCALLILSYARPKLTERRLNESRKLSESGFDIFSSVDLFNGPESDQIQDEFRNLQEKYSEVRWIINEHRLGLAEHLRSRVSEILEDYRNVIIIEDDVAFSTNSIIGIRDLQLSGLASGSLTVGLFGFLPNATPFRFPNNEWRKTKYFSAWGWAISREMWSLYDLNVVKKNGLKKIEKTPAWSNLNSHQKRRWSYRFSKVESNPQLTWDFQMQYISWLHGLSNLLPLMRSCENEGFEDKMATNTVGKKPRWYLGAATSNKFSTKVISTFDPRSILLERIDSYSWIGDKRLSDIYKL